MASTRLDPTWGERVTVSLELGLAPRTAGTCARVPPTPGSCSPLPERCPANHNSGGSTAEAGDPKGGGAWGAEGFSAVGRQEPSSALT